MPKIHIWQNPRTKQWHYTFVAHNGNKITSTEGYDRKRGALRAVALQYDFFCYRTWVSISAGIVYEQPKPSPRRKRKAR
jgi:uncharacterized protein YegP (UPF0339 family)